MNRDSEKLGQISGQREAKMAGSAGMKRPRDQPRIRDYEPEYKRFKECSTRLNNLRHEYDLAWFELKDAELGLPPWAREVLSVPYPSVTRYHMPKQSLIQRPTPTNPST